MGSTVIFDYSLIHWLSFLSAAMLLNIAPGPDIAFILGQTVRGGRRAGFAAMTGIWSGAFVHVLMASVGLSALLVASATAFTLVKIVGAIYLIWLGISALRSNGGGFVSEGTAPVQRWGRIYRQGVLIAILNPKVAIFFLAFLPQFVVPGAGPVWAQLFLHGILIIVVAGFVEPPLILAGERLTNGLRNNPRFGLWLDRCLGGLLIALGLRLALERH